ncbi:M20/M25/M40 family metallo-hydrolase [Mumia sp. zg.B53]|uniref:M20/M25/M40 family metallo-hydrolase n=1 Tax=unclassified Mumia TaxID=2621872 RepID=UPI001C6F0142|nr:MULTISPECIES: M20/M25/M40 family metallo-hydrolase [unclassified Mumia]MBW9209660.1 M20/M25/M40 family metallo-hydrolase [Mumia sp. zg.B21]MBW9214264.1 M20/M25/M40 family metallo-hydrolase [Mumia sp. zg.B53]
MRRALTGALGAAVAATLVTTATPAAAIDDVNTTQLRKAVTVNGILKHARALQVIANQNDGTRASGLPGYEASVDYVTKQLRRSGYSVKKQAFTFSFFRSLSEPTLSQVSPTATDYETDIYSYSGGGEVTGVVVPANDNVIPATEEPSSTAGCTPGSFDPAPAEDAIALVQRGGCDFAVKVDNAAAAGYDAVIIFNEGNPGRTELSIGTLGDPKDIPVVGLSYADAVALLEQAAAGPVTLSVSTEVETDPNRTTWNVIADLSPKDLKKVKNKDQVVVVGAHLDSVPEGPGINDNGSGSAGTLAIAQAMSDLKLTKKLSRPVRFAFWGAEESGLLGAEHYVASLSDQQRSKIYANLNFDMIGSPNYVRFVYDGDGSSGGPVGPPGSDVIETIFTDYFESQGLASEPTDFDGRSDYGPFIAAGIPAGGLFSGAEGVKTPEEAAVYGGTAGEWYDPCYHQACDDITNLSVKALNELGDAAAHATLTLTKSKSGLFPDGSRKANAAASAKAQALSAPAPARHQGHAATR